MMGHASWRRNAGSRSHGSNRLQLDHVGGREVRLSRDAIPEMDTVVLLLAADMSLGAMPHARQSSFDDCGFSLLRKDAPRFNAASMRFVQFCR
jgi:hypothetical protein